MDFNIEKGLFSLIYFIFLYYILVVLVILVKIKILEKNFFSYTICLWYILLCVCMIKKIKKNKESCIFLEQLEQLRQVFKFPLIHLNITI